MDAEATIRPLQVGDAPVTFAIAREAFGMEFVDAVDLKRTRERFEGRVSHLARSDPGGAFIAELEGRPVGAALALVREDVWGLSLLIVAAGHRDAGIGRRLLACTLAYGAGVCAGLILSSEDPRAIRSYARSGFALHPTLSASGSLDRRCLPAAPRAVRQGGDTDLDATAEISRRVRGASHAADIGEMLRQGARLLRLGDRGFAVHDGGEVRLLAALDEAAAQTLLWAVLAEGDPGAHVCFSWLTAAQGWAVDVAVSAGLDLAPRGPLCVRGAPGPLRPFIPSGPYL